MRLCVMPNVMMKGISEGATSVISASTHVIPEGRSRESRPCKTPKRLGLPTKTLGNDGMCVPHVIPEGRSR